MENMHEPSYIFIDQSDQMTEDQFRELSSNLQIFGNLFLRIDQRCPVNTIEVIDPEEWRRAAGVG